MSLLSSKIASFLYIQQLRQCGSKEGWEYWYIFCCIS